MSEQEYERALALQANSLQRINFSDQNWSQCDGKPAKNSVIVDRLALMKSIMHFRSKELNKRSAFPTKEVGQTHYGCLAS